MPLKLFKTTFLVVTYYFDWEDIAMKIILMGEPMGLFMANESGALCEVNTFTASIAGAEYNMAVGLARLGHTPAYCTRLGFDPLGERILNGLRQKPHCHRPGDADRIRPDRLYDESLHPEGRPGHRLLPEGVRRIPDHHHDIDGLDLYGCERLHVTGIFPAVSESALAATKRLMRRAEALELPISFDPNLRPQLWESEKKMVTTLNSLAQGVETILPGIAEGKILTGRDTPEGIAEFYHQMGVKNVIVKVGKDGAYFSEKGGKAGYSPAFPVREKVDTVGAGDGFAAGVISALAEGESLEEATFRGNVIGAIQITNRSDNEGLPTREELSRIILAGIA